MPLPKKRRGGRLTRPGGRLTRRGGFVHGRRGADDDESSDTGTKEGPAAYESRYEILLASRLAQLQLPAGADDSSDSDWEDDRPKLPPNEIVEALGGYYFNDGTMHAALVQDQVYKYSTETPGRDSSGDFDSESSHVAMDCDSGNVPKDLVNSGDDSLEEFATYSEELEARTLQVDKRARLDEAQIDELDLRYALYRIKACMLLKGKSIDKLDDAALRRKYPRDLILENNFFLHYEKDRTFGWCFDFELCQLADLNDYQRLVLLNYPLNYAGSAYLDLDRYQSFYSTHVIDQEYLQYCEAISQRIKWIEDYMLSPLSGFEWMKVYSRGTCQAIKLAATSFCKIPLDLANLGFQEYIWSVRGDDKGWKERGGIFFEIWKRVIGQEKSFRDALKEVCELKKFPLRQHIIERELEQGSLMMEELFRRCTAGITKQVPDYRAFELIAREVRYVLPMPGGYEQYARKKLKIAEYIGLIPKLST